MPRFLDIVLARDHQDIGSPLGSKPIRMPKYKYFYLFAAVLVAVSLPSSSFARFIDMPPPDLEIAQTGKSPTSNAGASKPSTDNPQPPSGGTIPIDDNFLIVEVRLNDFQLAEALPAYLNQGSIMLPLSEFLRAVDFPITVRPEAGTADGWFLQEDRLFTLDLSRALAIVKGKKEPFSPSQVGIIEDDIFVDVRLISKWFPLDINFDLSNLLVTLESREALPVEQRLAREKKREKIFGRAGRAQESYPKKEIPYKVIGWPITDSSMTYNFSKSETGNTKAFEQTTFITGDIGKMNAEGFFASTQSEQFSQVRVKIGRRDPAGRMLGRLKATDIAFGDVLSPQIPMISSTNLGRGFLISSMPLDQPTEFDRITLEGDLPNGWEVEVYRNEVLLDFRTSRSDGRYVFEDVPLLFGVNVIRLGFYGPQGQFREETRQIRVDADQVKPGDHQYKVTFNQQDTQLLLGEKDNSSDSEDLGSLRFFTEYATGISKSFSMAAGLSNVPIEGEAHQYLNLSGRASMGRVFTRADVVRDLSEGWAFKLASRTSLRGINMIAEHDRLFDFVSEKFESTSDPTEHDTTLRMDGALNPVAAVHLPFSLSGDHTQQRSGDTSSSLSGRLSGAMNATTLTKTLKWQLDKTETSRTTTVDGSFLVGGRIEKVRVRGQLSYTFAPLMDLTSSSISGDWRVNKSLNATAGINVDLTETGETTFSTGLNSDLKVAALGFNLDYSTNNEINARVTLSFSTARDPRNPLIPTMASTRMASTGAMSVRVFLDKNDNGKFDDGDEPLEGVAFQVDGTKTRQRTDDQGYAFVTGIDVHTPINFSVDKGSLEDPYWAPSPEGAELVLRPGVTGDMQIAVVTTGEIDGTVYRRRGDWADPVADVNVQLVDADGKVVKQTKSAYDGFYLLDFIRPGEYSLRIDPEQVTRLGLQLPDPASIKIAGDGTLINGKDFFLDRIKAERTFRVLLTSFRQRELAVEAWEKLKTELPSSFRQLRSMVEVRDLGGETGVVHNLFVGPLKTREKGEKLCINVRILRDNVWCNPLTIQAR
jgi:hypothetical protein